jgi:hypothetical protein
MPDMVSSEALTKAIDWKGTLLSELFLAKTLMGV